MDFQLSDRKKAILSSTVESYIKTAEPVGSKSLSSDFGCSSATIRQELADLENEGLLMHLHTSSGRVPTDMGYRYYVDVLMKQNTLSSSDQLALRSVVGALSTNLSDSFSHISQAVASLIDYTIIVLTPDIFIESLKVIHLIMVDLDRIMVVLLHAAGVNKEFLLTIPPDRITQDDLNRISKLLTEKLEGRSLSDLDEATLSDLVRTLPEYHSILVALSQELQKLHSSTRTNRQLVTSGTSKMLKLPEFKNIEFAQKVLSTLEESKVLLDLLSYHQSEDRSKVLIGPEHHVDDLKECSLVVSPFKGNGALGILGPKRMAYDTIVPLAQSISEMVTAYLSRTHGGENHV
jgi:heat-inducible transcriptional repressor